MPGTLGGDEQGAAGSKGGEHGTRSGLDQGAAGPRRKLEVGLKLVS